MVRRIALPALLLLTLLLQVTTTHAESLRLAVMDFTDASPQGSLAHLGKGLQSMMTTDLAAASTFSLVERARLRDVESELKLQRKGSFDAKTAVKVGKLVGASHLVSGSFTVLGEKMRIDCRLVEVSSGKVMLAENVEGEKAAFFELEKSLVQKVVGSLGATVTPKERAQMAKVHTADFEAFHQYSQGVAEFDEQRYEAALKALRAATQIDSEFRLAQITLAGYEEIVSKAHASVDAAKQAETELARLENDREGRLAADILGKLLKQSKTGSALDRGAALVLLMQAYGKGESYVTGPFKSVIANADPFLRERTRESFYKAYWSLAVESAPLLPFYPLMSAHLPEKPEKLDAALAEVRKELQNRSRIELERQRDGDMLHLDALQQAQRLERIYQLELKNKPPEAWKVNALIHLGEQYQKVLDLDRSTAYLVQAQKSTKDSSLLEKVAKLLEGNADRARFLAKNDPLAQRYGITKHERIALRDRNVRAEDVADKLMWIRKVDGGFEREYRLISNHPMWTSVHGNDADLVMSARIDPLRSESVSYSTDDDFRSSLMVAGAAPAGNFKVSYTVPLEMPALVRDASSESEREKLRNNRPGVSFLFGLRNVKPDVTPEGYAVRITKTAVSLVKVAIRGNNNTFMWQEPALATTAMDLSKASQLAVQFEHSNGQLSVSINGQKWSTKVPADAQQGFVGFAFDGVGCAGLRDLQIERK